MIVIQDKNNNLLNQDYDSAIQENFLSKIVNEKLPVCIYLKGGIKINTFIKYFDNQAVYIQAHNLYSAGCLEAVYKQVISTITIESEPSIAC